MAVDRAWVIAKLTKNVQRAMQVEPVQDREGKPFYPGIQYYVGGNTKVYGAALLRFREQDFDEVRHHGGISPAWPLSY